MLCYGPDSICHMPVLYWNGGMNQAHFWNKATAYHEHVGGLVGNVLAINARGRVQVWYLHKAIGLVMGSEIVFVNIYPL